MLDGLLGRSGFYSKCKSVIKQTRTRIEVVRRKRNATQKFLRKDIADLLSSGLDTNAFGRADGLMAELILISCYDFIDHVCEIILKHLPVLQKLRDCPEDCREAVGSLMFAAARFSDLPELRELRDLFQERYGSALEHFVNQKLVENITPKPPSTEKKIQLMQEIASEFAIRWDSRGFEERMSIASAMAQDQRRIPGTLHGVENKVPTPSVAETVHQVVKDDILTKKRSETTYISKERENKVPTPRVAVTVHKADDDGVMLKKRSEASIKNKDREDVDRQHGESGRDVNLGRRNDLKHDVCRGPEISAGKFKPPSCRQEVIQKREENASSYQRNSFKNRIGDTEGCSAREAVQLGTLHRAKTLEAVDVHQKRDRHRGNNLLDRDMASTLPRHRSDPLPANNGSSSPSALNNELAEDKLVRSSRPKQEDAKEVLKTSFRNAIPPPYVKPSRSKHKADLGFQHDGVNSTADENDTLTFKPVTHSNRSEKAQTKADQPECQNGVTASENTDVPVRHTEVYYSDATPRRRSHRKKHSRPTSTHDDKANGDTGKEEERVVRRVSTSRRKHESRKGLQIVFDDDPGERNDEEEKVIDKLLLHYSKKPSAVDPEKTRRETRSKTVDKTNKDDLDSAPTTSRSLSLPSQQFQDPVPKKVFARAASFQDEIPAKHVHPKLPDYDDLAARFNALKAYKG